MSVLAAIRPDSWDVPLFIHVLGAMVLVGGLLVTTALLATARGDERLLRLGYRTLLVLALPGWVLMRVGGEWLYTKFPEGLPDPDWIGVGYIVADAGGLIMVVSLIVGGIGVRRLGEGKGSGLLKTTLVLSIIALAAYTVAVWAMAGKPG